MTPVVATTLNTRDGRITVPGHSGPKLILSVFPLEQFLELRHEGIKRYVMPAAPKGAYSTLLVHDTYAWNRNWHDDAFSLFQAPISAGVVAANLVQVWAQNQIGTEGGLGPGILICADLEPTEDEIAAANAKQEDYFRFLVNQADTFYGQDNLVAITGMHRLAAEWMGATREWRKPIEQVKLVACPACGEEIRNIAKVCRWCHTDLREFDKPAKK